MLADGKVKDSAEPVKNQESKVTKKDEVVIEAKEVE